MAAVAQCTDAARTVGLRERGSHTVAVEGAQLVAQARHVGGKEREVVSAVPLRRGQQAAVPHEAPKLAGRLQVEPEDGCMGTGMSHAAPRCRRLTPNAPFLEHQLRRRLRRLLGGAVLALGVGVLQVVGDGVTGLEEEEDLIRIGAPQAPTKGDPHRILDTRASFQSAHMSEQHTP